MGRFQGLFQFFGEGQFHHLKPEAFGSGDSWMYPGPNVNPCISWYLWVFFIPRIHKVEHNKCHGSTRTLGVYTVYPIVMKPPGCSPKPRNSRLSHGLCQGTCTKKPQMLAATFSRADSTISPRKWYEKCLASHYLQQTVGLEKRTCNIFRGIFWTNFPMDALVSTTTLGGLQ